MKIEIIIIGLFCSIPFIFGCENQKGAGNKTLSLIQSLMIMQDCYYQNNNVDIGIGLLLWVGDCEKPVSFYKDKNLSQKVYELIFCNQPKEVCPIFYKPDYDIMHFAVKSKKQTSYEVYVNDIDTMFLSANEQFTFVTWEDFLLNHTTAVRKINRQEIYTVKSVIGDFITVENEQTNEQKQIKWKEKNKLLIEIMLLI